jgi:hypothetical protein
MDVWEEFKAVLGVNPQPGFGLLWAIGFVLVRTRRPIAQRESTAQRCSLQDKSRAWLCHPQDERVSRAASDLIARLQARLDEVHPSVPAVCASARR